MVIDARLMCSIQKEKGNAGLFGSGIIFWKMGVQRYAKDPIHKCD